MQKLLAPVTCAIAALALTACASNAPKPATNAAAGALVDSPTGISAAIAPTTAGGTTKGVVKFTPEGNNVRVSGTIMGLTANSRHAFHVHEKGSCGDQGNAAGGHWNPTHMPHGEMGVGNFHVGDMPPLQTDANGTANFNFTSQSLAVSGPNSILGKAVIVHAMDDDFAAQPTGNAGARIGCGIVRP